MIICEFYYVDKSKNGILPKCDLMINVIKDWKHKFGVFGFTYFTYVNETTNYYHSQNRNSERASYSLLLKKNYKLQILSLEKENKYNIWQLNLIQDKSIFYSMIENIHLYKKDLIEDVF